MTLQRNVNPLPRGVYWQDFFNPPVGGASIANFQKWLTANLSTVKLRASEFHGKSVDPLQAFVQGAWTLNPALAAVANRLPGTGTERLWALFEVLQPTVWPATAFGYPTIASLSTTEADTVQKPPPEREGVDLIKDVASDVASGVASGAASLSSGIVAPLLLGVGAVLGLAVLLKSK